MATKKKDEPVVEAPAAEEEVEVTVPVITSMAEINRLEGLTAAHKKAFEDHDFTGVLKVKDEGALGLSGSTSIFSWKVIAPNIKLVVFNWNPCYTPDSSYFNMQVRRAYKFETKGSTPEETVTSWKEMFATAKAAPAFVYAFMGNAGFNPEDKAVILAVRQDVKPVTFFKGQVAGV